MLMIRLARGGAKKRPFYKIVVADSRCPRDGRCLDYVGSFNPIAAGKEQKIRLELERIEQWRAKGAQCSQRVKTIIAEFTKAATSTATPAAA